MNILLIEDEARLAELIKRGLEEQSYSVTVAFDGQMGKKLALSNAFDLIITDIILPKINGLDLCKEIRSARPDVPIIMLTAMGTTDDKVEGFDAGADDYLVKPVDLRELYVRIRVLLKRNVGKTREQGFILKYSDLTMNLQTRTVKRGSKEIELTKREYSLLEYMIRNPDRVLSRVEIAEKVWETPFDTGTNFIDVYIKISTKILIRKRNFRFLILINNF